MKIETEPLTLEQLRKEYERSYEETRIVGMSVLIKLYGVKCAGVIDRRNSEGMCGVYAANGTWLKERDYGKTWLAYPYPLPHIDREAWICGFCEVPSHWVEWGNLRYRYCPHCGRPLTEEAWAELERRLRK